MALCIEFVLQLYLECDLLVFQYIMNPHVIHSALSLDI